jgi:ABC-type transport system substrate-binding protein
MPNAVRNVLVVGALVALSVFLFRDRAGTGARDEGQHPAASADSRVIVPLPYLPPGLCYPLVGRAEVRQVLDEIHETLLRKDEDTDRLVPNVAQSHTCEDIVVLGDLAPAGLLGEVEVAVLVDQTPRAVRAIVGTVEETSDGFVVTTRDASVSRLAREHVSSVRRRAVITFTLRDDVRWQRSLVGAVPASHAEQRLDARDVWFSWAIHTNPELVCKATKPFLGHVAACQVVDSRTVRLQYDDQYALGLDWLGTTLTLLPSHLYDLTDPDHLAHDASASASARAEAVSSNPHNELWVGLGPYQVTQFGPEHIEARRVAAGPGAPAHFDPLRAGHIDVLRWRVVSGPGGVVRALIEGELDAAGGLRGEDCQLLVAQARGGPPRHTILAREGAQCGVLGWNLRRPPLDELVVRQALARAIDLDVILANQYPPAFGAHARWVPALVPRAVERRLPELQRETLDTQAAIELLEDAGWFDRDGDGQVDRAGESLEFRLSIPAGHERAQAVATLVQADARRIGVVVEIEPMEGATLQQRVAAGDFQAYLGSFTMPAEFDPDSVYGSRWAAPGAGGVNTFGVDDMELDRLIAGLSCELDAERRDTLWRELRDRVHHSVQPGLLWSPPVLFAADSRLLGVRRDQTVRNEGLRDWSWGQR